MNGAHLEKVDLNLIVAFDVLLDERHVTRAAARLGVTQSAMSHTLGRLRALFADPLFVRGAGGMIATPHAEALRVPVARWLEDAARVLAPPAPFSPLTARRTFTIAGADYGELVLMPALLARLAAAAPLVDVVVRPPPDDVLGALASGSIDLVLGPPTDAAPGLLQQRLFDERFVSVVRRDHPTVKRRPTLAQFAALRHALISPTGRGRAAVDEALAAHGLSRRIALRLPNFLAAPFVIAQTDFVLTLPARIAARFEAHVPLRVFAPPLAVRGFAVAQLWHERNQRDPGHAWLRRALLEESRRV